MLILDLNFLIEPVPAFQKMCTPSKQIWHILPKGIWSLSPKEVRNSAQLQPSWSIHPGQHQKAINLYSSKPAPESNKWFSSFFLKMVQYPPPMYNKENSNDLHMCVKVYRTYAYNIILLGSIAVVYFIGAIILAHTHRFIAVAKTYILLRSTIYSQSSCKMGILKF